jgi:hypothetical protein
MQYKCNIDAPRQGKHASFCWLLALSLALTGCTTITLDRPDGSRLRYVSVLQRKALTINTETPDGSLSATYGTDSDAAALLARELSALAGQAARGAAK